MDSWRSIKQDFQGERDNGVESKRNKGLIPSMLSLR